MEIHLILNVYMSWKYPKIKLGAQTFALWQFLVLSQATLTLSWFRTVNQGNSNLTALVWIYPQTRSQASYPVTKIHQLMFWWDSSEATSVGCSVLESWSCLVLSLKSSHQSSGYLQTKILLSLVQLKYAQASALFMQFLITSLSCLYLLSEGNHFPASCFKL